MKTIKWSILLYFLVAGCSPQEVKPKTVKLDYYFNHEFKKDSGGRMIRYHYTWEDSTYDGFSKFGAIFRKNNLITDSLGAAPTMQNLKNADIYIIVDPDTKKENPNPNYIQPADVSVIDNWVKSGGVLVMMANDSANVELPHFNTLAETFGIHFNNDLLNPVPNDSFELGCFSISDSNRIFKTAKKVYLKGICSLALSGAAKSVLSSGENVIMATAKYGKGSVFAVGDPWLYNEYVNGRIPASYHIDNFKAGDDLVKWLIKQIPAK